ncbi:GtrA family protein [Altererythrobacter sp. Z27]|uniref:GtrA family protein n=1 Tax=Altererythrobacter sp. Z27 TaxID=3461147 RepID=UPI0040444539
MISILAKLRDIRLVRYGLASVGALAVDVGTFLGLMAAGTAAPLAAALGYAFGIVVHWLLSSRKVFHDQVAASGRARTQQKALFVISALAGLALTTAIVAAGDHVGIDPRIAKLAAIVASFTLTYLLRAKVVFQRGLD